LDVSSTVFRGFLYFRLRYKSTRSCASCFYVQTSCCAAVKIKLTTGSGNAGTCEELHDRSRIRTRQKAGVYASAQMDGRTDGTLHFIRQLAACLSRGVSQPWCFSAVVCLSRGVSQPWCVYAQRPSDSKVAPQTKHFPLPYGSLFGDDISSLDAADSFC
jgi:hypothetical protein